MYAKKHLSKCIDRMGKDSFFSLFTKKGCKLSTKDAKDPVFWYQYTLLNVSVARAEATHGSAEWECSNSLTSLHPYPTRTSTAPLSSNCSSSTSCPPRA